MQNFSTLEKIFLPDSICPRVVVIGGWFADLALVVILKHKEVQLVLIDKNNFHHFQPGLYQGGTIAFEPDCSGFLFRKQIQGYKNLHFSFVEIEEKVPGLSTLITNNGKVHYDYLGLATGTTTNLFGIVYGISSQQPLDRN